MTINDLKKKVTLANKSIDYMNRRQKVFIDERKRQQQTQPNRYVPKVASTFNVEEHPNGIKPHLPTPMSKVLG